MTEQAHHCSSGLTKTFTCVQFSNTYLSATLTTAAFPTAAACRGVDASACTPTPRDLLSSHWQLRLHFIWRGSQPFIYRCAPRGTRTQDLSPVPMKTLPSYTPSWVAANWHSSMCASGRTISSHTYTNMTMTIRATCWNSFHTISSRRTYSEFSQNPPRILQKS